MFGNKKRNSETLIVSSEVSPIDNVRAEYKALKIVLVIFIFIGVAIVQQLWKLKDDYRTVIQFAGGSQMTITGTTVDENYLISAATWINQMWLIAQPATASKQFATLLTLIHPTRYGVMQQKFNERATVLQQLKSTSLYGTFEVDRGLAIKELESGIYAQVKKPMRFVYNATKAFYVGASENPGKVERTSVYVDYVVENGRFWILDIGEIKREI